mmetsp:Transcript_16726/g.25275  ORF Transcript_16726/g.25275 Transcript_16726/m.25275 type:complete len:110 (-) Transcript_16726:239-568(-)
MVRSRKNKWRNYSVYVVVIIWKSQSYSTFNSFKRSCVNIDEFVLLNNNLGQCLFKEAKFYEKGSVRKKTIERNALAATALIYYTSSLSWPSKIPTSEATVIFKQELRKS